MNRKLGSRPEALRLVRQSWSQAHGYLCHQQTTTGVVGRANTPHRACPLAALAQASDSTQETERIIFHVERRWIEAIRRQADLDGLTITQVVNQAFKHHFDCQ